MGLIGSIANLSLSMVNQVSLRGASVKEQSRDELLGRVAHERAIRSLAKQAASSALLIQVGFLKLSFGLNCCSSMLKVPPLKSHPEY
jgi:hypothetical protein